MFDAKLVHCCQWLNILLLLWYEGTECFNVLATSLCDRNATCFLRFKLEDFLGLLQFRVQTLKYLNHKINILKQAHQTTDCSPRISVQSYSTSFLKSPQWFPFWQRGLRKCGSDTQQLKLCYFACISYL